MAQTLTRNLGGTITGSRGTVQGRNTGTSPFALESNKVRMQSGAGLYSKMICFRYDASRDVQSGKTGSCTLGVLGPLPYNCILSGDGLVYCNASVTTTAASTLTLVLQNPVASFSSMTAASLTASSVSIAYGTAIYVSQSSAATVTLVKAATTVTGIIDWFVKLHSVDDVIPLNFGLTYSSYS